MLRPTLMRIQAFLLALLVLILVTLPYLQAANAAGADFVFGGFLLNPLDGNTYLAKMYEGWRGEWHFTLPYTAEPGAGSYLFLFYIFLGHLARILGLPLLVTFHAARLVCSLLMLWALYRWLRAPLQQMPWGGLIFALAVLGAGMGWLAVPFGAFTSDFWVAETYPFLSAYANPHFPLGLALLLWLLPPLQAGADGAAPAIQTQPGWLLAGLAVLLAIIVPFGIVVVLVILAGLALWEVAGHWLAGRAAGVRVPLAELVKSTWSSDAVRCSVWIALGSAPVLLYDFWAVRSNPALAVWNAQNLTPTPPVWDLLLSLSPAFLLAIPGALLAFKRRESSDRLLLVWAGLGLLLLYLPLGLQRRFMMGLFVPLVVLAAYGIQKLASRRAGVLALLVLLLSLLTNLLVLMAANYGMRTHDALLYLTRDESQALEWITANTPADALVLAAPQTGMFIPAHTGRRVVYGHPFETVDADNQEQAVTQFFSTPDIPQAQAFLSVRQVDYVFFGPREQELGALPELNNLQPVYSAGAVTVYQVVEK